MSGLDYDAATVAAIQGCSDAITALSGLVDTMAAMHDSLKATVALHGLAIDAQTEILDQCATLSDLDSLHSEMLSRTATPFDQDAA